MQGILRILRCVVAMFLLVVCSPVIARVPVYFYAVGNWYGGWNWQTHTAELLAHQYPDGVSAFTVEWNQHITPCYNGAGPGYLFESARPSPSAYYLDDDNYEAFYTSLNFYNCGEPSQPHQWFGDGAQRYVTCGGLTLWTHMANGPDVCPRANIDPEKNRGTPRCPCNAVGDPINSSTGNKYDILPIYSGTGPFPLKLAITYNSMTGTSGALGRARQVLGRQRVHSYMRTVRVSAWGLAATAYVLRPDGKTYAFDRNGNDWAGDPDVTDRLSAVYGSDGMVLGWMFRAGNGDIETYDAAGRLVRIARDGFFQDFSYDVLGRLLAVVDPQGRRLTFSYRDDGKLSAISSPDGDTVLTYDATENVTRVTWPDGTHRDYLYAEASGQTVQTHTLTGSVDESGVRVDNAAYDSNERAILDAGPDGVGTTSVAYEENNGVFTSTVTHPLGRVEKVEAYFQFGTAMPFRRTVSCEGCTTQTTTYTYDANGYMATRGEPNGTVTLFTYDAAGLLLKKIQASGTALQRTTSTTWNADLRKVLKETVSDSRGATLRVKGFAYNNSGQQTAECLIDVAVAPSYVCTSSVAAPAGVRRATNTYCETADADCPLIGLLKLTHGPRTGVNDTVSYAYYATTDETGCAVVGGPCHHLGDVESVVDGAGIVTTFVSYDKAGRVSRVRDPNGVLTDYTYTSRGWLTTRVIRADPSGTPSSFDGVTTIIYDPVGTVHSVKDADGVTITYTYDRAQRLTDVVDDNGGKIHYTLDAEGNRIGEQVSSVTGAIVKTTTRTFNAMSQPTSIVDGLGRTVFSASAVESYDSGGNLAISRDGLGVATKYSVDGLNRLISTVRDYHGSDIRTRDSQWIANLDLLGRLAGFSDPDGLTTTYDLDALGNTTGIQSPDNGQSKIAFDLAGNRIASIDSSGAVAQARYDAKNRMLTTSYADPARDIEYKYDESDAVTGCMGSASRGRLSRILEMGGGIALCYDARGNVVSRSQTVGTELRVTRYAWTPGNRVKSTITPNGTTISYVRNILGQITAIAVTSYEGTAMTILSDVTYNSFGAVTSYTLGNGQVVSRSYDLAGGLIDISSTALSLHFRRDAMGNITALSDVVSGSAVETYVYDALNRLTAVKDSAGTVIESYTYSKTGDRLTKSAPGFLTGTYVYEAGTHHLMSVGSAAWAYDAQGNAVSSTRAGSTHTFVYSQRGRLTGLLKDGLAVADYQLNALGQRVKKQVGESITRYDYDEQGRLISEAAEGSTRDYVWLDSMLVGLVDRESGLATPKFVHADGFGSPRAVTGADGTVEWEWSYASNPFGEKQPRSAVGYKLNLRFPGQYFDVESGLSYNHNRDYDAASGRYIQSDPLGFRGGLSSYSYAYSNPGVNFDPSGLAACRRIVSIKGMTREELVGSAVVGAGWELRNVHVEPFPTAAGINVRTGLASSFGAVKGALSSKPIVDCEATYVERIEDTYELSQDTHYVDLCFDEDGCPGELPFTQTGVDTDKRREARERLNDVDGTMTTLKSWFAESACLEWLRTLQ